MKLLFGALGALMLIAFLSAIIVKVPEVALGVVMAIGVGMAVVDLWQARNEADT
jgi:hypothetical protein